MDLYIKYFDKDFCCALEFKTVQQFNSHLIMAPTEYLQISL